MCKLRTLNVATLIELADKRKSVKRPLKTTLREIANDNISMAKDILDGLSGHLDEVCEFDDEEH